MHYDPIKEILGNAFGKKPFLRKLFYLMLDILLLRSWHVHKALRRLGRDLAPGSVILDAGMGFGQYTWWMSRRFPKSTITAADIKKEQVADCNDFFRKCGINNRVKAVEADLVTWTSADRFDMILCVDVMEHISEDTRVFSNFFNSLGRNGVLIISTPSDKGGSDVHDPADESFIGEHVRDGYSVEDITSKLSQAGFENITAEYTYGRPGSVAWRLSMKYPVIMLSASKLFFILIPLYYLAVMPLCIILNYFDTIIRHREGTGLLVMAERKR